MASHGRAEFQVAQVPSEPIVVEIPVQYLPGNDVFFSYAVSPFAISIDQLEQLRIRDTGEHCTIPAVSASPDVVAPSTAEDYLKESGLESGRDHLLAIVRGLFGDRAHVEPALQPRVDEEGFDLVLEAHYGLPVDAPMTDDLYDKHSEVLRRYISEIEPSVRKRVVLERFAV